MHYWHLNGYLSIVFIKFALFRQSLDGEMKRLQDLGVGSIIMWGSLRLAPIIMVFTEKWKRALTA